MLLAVVGRSRSARTRGDCGVAELHKFALSSAAAAGVDWRFFSVQFCQTFTRIRRGWSELARERVIEGQHQYACTCPIVPCARVHRRILLRLLVAWVVVGPHSKCVCVWCGVFQQSLCACLLACTIGRRNAAHVFIGSFIVCPVR